jgi:hypothetical protein
VPGFVQFELYWQLYLHDDRRPQRQRLVQRQLHLPYHLHRLLFGELHERDLRYPVRGRHLRSLHSERWELSLTSGA